MSIAKYRTPRSALQMSAQNKAPFRSTTLICISSFLTPYKLEQHYIKEDIFLRSFALNFRQLKNEYKKRATFIQNYSNPKFESNFDTV